MPYVERQLWEEIVERHPVVPPRGGALLVIGDEGPAQMLAAGDVLVAQCGWGEKPAKGLAYDRVLMVANSAMPDAELALAQVAELMKPEGVLVIVAARLWPWGARGTVWFGGMHFAAWKRVLRAGGWRLDYAATAGFGVTGGFLRYLPFAGMVRVMAVSRKPGGGGGLRVAEPRLMPKGKTAVVVN